MSKKHLTTGEKYFTVTIHSEDTECMVIAYNEHEAREKFDNGEIDEWLTAEYEQPEITVKEG